MRKRQWNKMFIIEVNPHIPYPKHDERWPKYGEPISRLFAPYFKGERTFQWFKDDSGTLLTGLNVACFGSSAKWSESDNDQKDIWLFASLSQPVNDFFVRLGGGASITGLSHVNESLEDFTAQLAIAKASRTSAGRAFLGQLPVEFDSPDPKREMDIVELSGRSFLVYTGRQTGCKRFRGLSKEQAIEIANANHDQTWGNSTA